MSLLVPYTNDMKLGQGFVVPSNMSSFSPVSWFCGLLNTCQTSYNSYMQEVRLLHAVTISSCPWPGSSMHGLDHSKALDVADRPRTPGTNTEAGEQYGHDDSTPSARTTDSRDAVGRILVEADPKLLARKRSVAAGEDPVDQIVTFSSRSVSSMSEIVDSLNVSSNLSIKCGSITAKGSAGFVNESQVGESDLNFIVTVKVSNENSDDALHMVFNDMPNLGSTCFTEVYGDCFISGFVTGGEFSAIISIQVEDKSKVNEVKLAAEAALSVPAGPVPGPGIGGGASFGKSKKVTSHNTSTSYSISWSGGGEINISNYTGNLDEILGKVIGLAVDFPPRVAKSAINTSAILTKYTCLPSFQRVQIARAVAGQQYQILDYSLCQIYTKDLLDAFMTYKALWRKIGIMLIEPRRYKKHDMVLNAYDPEPNCLNEARLECRRAMTLIQTESKALEHDPSRAECSREGSMLTKMQYDFPDILRNRLPILIQDKEIIADNVEPFPLVADEIQFKQKFVALEAQFQLSDLGGRPTSYDGKLGPVISFPREADLRKPDKRTDVLAVSILGANHRLQDSHDHAICAIGMDYKDDPQDAKGSMLYDSSVCQNYFGTPNHKYSTEKKGLTQRTGGIVELVVEYSLSSNYIIGLTMNTVRGDTIQYKQYLQRNHPGLPPPDAEVVRLKAPPGWKLAGFWGREQGGNMVSVGSKALIRLGAIWRPE